MKVLIYGYGWSGKSALALCEKIGFECFVVDDALDIHLTQDRHFITKEDITGMEFDIVLVCTTHEDYCLQIVAGLQSFQCNKNKIKWFNTHIFRDKMEFLVHKYFGETKEVLKQWLEDSFAMPNLCMQLKLLEKEYHTHKRHRSESNLEWIGRIRTKMPMFNVFQKIHKGAFRMKNKLDFIYYPGFSLSAPSLEGLDKNFYFRNAGGGG